MSELIPAATVVLVRDGGQGLEVLLLRRSKALSFAGGFWVFPGGRIDLADYPSNKNVEQAARCAAVRECVEETQLVVSECSLTPLSHWVPPKGLARSFSTWFFIAHYQAVNDVVVDNGEIDQAQWLTPSQALDGLKNKQLPMMPPTFVTLTELAKCKTASQAMKYYENRSMLNYSASRWHDMEQGRCMLYEGDAGYKADNPNVPGARHRLVDVAGEWRYEVSG